MSTFFTIPTQIGLNEFADATIDQQAVPFTHIALGDGNGNPVTPNTNQTQLINEVHRAEISNISPHPEHANWVIFEAVVPENVGGWTIREIGLIGGRNSPILIAAGNYPDTQKTTLADGAGRALIINMVCAFADAAQVQLSLNQNGYASINFVQAQIAAHEAKADPHPQYLTRAEADEFYDAIGLAAQAINQDAARLSSHVAHADPHPQYLNAARATSRDLGNLAEQFFYAAG